MQNRQRAVRLAVVVVLAGASLAVAETRKEFRFHVGRRANISVVNQYGAVSVKPGSNSDVLVTAVLYSDKVEPDHIQAGSRVDFVSHLLPGATQETGRVDYELEVPAGATVSVQSATGPLNVEGLRGDVAVEGTVANVTVRQVTGGHVRVRTLSGPVTLTNIEDGHVEVTSVSGDVTLTAVNGPSVQVNSNSGKISYDGLFGAAGDYSLTSHTGDIEAVAPSYASMDVVARSEHGEVDNDFSLQPRHSSFPVKAKSAFEGTIGKAASSVKLFSISGKIHLKKR
ncbi:MAG TPA: DUF4097 family beta strand repeat-containing protein [Terriglobales bacterium]|nr:DUF4097 family beta strand repeat-containing protein [Terriglobales bacterium]